MTVKKAIEMIENLRRCEEEAIKIFSENGEIEAKVRSISLGKIRYLENILREIQPKCKHPKKMRDKTADGQWYCMNCNLDLSNPFFNLS